MHLLEDKQNSASMIEGLNFSAIIDSNPANELVDDQMVDDLVLAMSNTSVAVNFISCCGNAKERYMVHR